MEIKQLKYFQRIAHIGNITKASEQLHVAQPALSLSIKKLEQTLSLELFDRSCKPLALTYEGEIFLKRVDALLEQYDDLVEEMKDYLNMHKGHIRIGVPPMLGAYLFPPIFSEFHRDYPGIELSIIEEGTLEIKRRLIQDDLDVGVIMVIADAPQLSILPITTHEVKVCLPKSHPLSQRRSLSISELKDESFILLNEQTFMRKRILDLCHESGYEPHILFSSNQISTILGLVAQGAGVAFVLQSLAEGVDEIASVSLEVPLTIQAALAWRSERYRSKATQTFIDFIQAFSSRFD
ncbi:LysR family transcriptional regulator [Fusibacter paucivorans]|uniref:LysR family transcriptional regulator n=1 Tax=Fusibacter paucivorans TaxID=76009 RepID=A0ABS5PM80_9FIRM|nr:LysR family transcriptional regulator [Fusibacter paucivorans]MBS7526002.1 LysR family transcriptional regulator [Fusibacter paucivorans]